MASTFSATWTTVSPAILNSFSRSQRPRSSARFATLTWEARTSSGISPSLTCAAPPSSPTLSPWARTSRSATQCAMRIRSGGAAVRSPSSRSATSLASRARSPGLATRHSSLRGTHPRPRSACSDRLQGASHRLWLCLPRGQEMPHRGYQEHGHAAGTTHPRQE